MEHVLLANRDSCWIYLCLKMGTLIVTRILCIVCRLVLSLIASNVRLLICSRMACVSQRFLIAHNTVGMFASHVRILSTAILLQTSAFHILKTANKLSRMVLAHVNCA